MHYVSQSTNTSPWDREFTAGNIPNVSIVSIVRKNPTALQQVMEDKPSQQFTGICNRVHVIKSQRDKNVLRKRSKKIDPSSVK